MLEISPWKAKTSSFFTVNNKNVHGSSCIFFRFYPNESSGQISMQVFIIKLDENPSSSNQTVQCWQMDMLKLIATFRNYAKALENSFTSHSRSNQYGSSRRIHRVRAYV